MILPSRLTPEQLAEAKRLFGVPEQFSDAVEPMMREVEWQLILAMGERDVPDAELRELCVGNRLAEDAYDLIRESYHRCVIDKVKDAETPAWHISCFFERYPVYAQYEHYDFSRYPREVIEALYEWRIGEVLRRRAHLIQQKKDGTADPPAISQTYVTLDEAMAWLEQNADLIHLHACNCKSLKPWQTKPLNTCMPMNSFPNSQTDRGYGEKLTLEQAKARVRELNACGLMQSRESHGLCNCDGVCCQPLQTGRRMDSRGRYPQSNYTVEHHADECIGCGRCAQICNFGAFRRTESGEIAHDPDKCWGCTLCSSHCPAGAIRLIPRR